MYQLCNNMIDIAGHPLTEIDVLGSSGLRRFSFLHARLARGCEALRTLLWGGCVVSLRTWSWRSCPHSCSRLPAHELALHAPPATSHPPQPGTSCIPDPRHGIVRSSARLAQGLTPNTPARPRCLSPINQSPGGRRGLAQDHAVVLEPALLAYPLVCGRHGAALSTHLRSAYMLWHERLAQSS
jgi:hypothetical protein